MSNQNSPDIIFLFPYSLTAWDAERYGFNVLIAKGLEIHVFDISALISTRLNNHSTYLEENYIKKIKSYLILEQQIKQHSKHSIYIDCINGLNGFQWNGRKIFNLFKKYNVTYYIIEIGSLPLALPQHRIQIISKIKKALNIPKLVTFIKWKLGKWAVHFQCIYFNWYQFPTKIFVGNTEMLTTYLSKYHLNPCIVIPIHSFDYDKYLHYLRDHVSITSEEKICVFLDQALAYHSDFGNAVSFRPVTSKKYIASMNQFFDKIERETGLHVVIAASPRAQSEMISAMFGNRTVIKNKTVELVAKSSLVLMHSSTAVSFAVLFNKPILLIKTVEMLNAHGFSIFLDNMAIALNLKPICIDYVDEVQKLILTNYSDWQKNYDDYKYKYVMTKGLKDKTIWDIVADEARN